MCYKIAAIAGALMIFILRKQKNRKSLLNSTRRFKVAQEGLTSDAGGSNYLPKWIAACLDYDASSNDKLEALNKEADKRLATYFY